MTVFSVQDETGTVTQLTLSPSPLPAHAVAVGDAGVYAGIPDNGTNSFAVPSFQSLPFVVSQVLDTAHFSVQTNNSNMADWPANGEITWTVGANATTTSFVISIDGANSYASVADFKLYHTSRGNSFGTAADATIQPALVKATDYLDHRYSYSGVKRLQTIGNSLFNQNIVFLEAWLTPYSLRGVSYLTPSTTTQSTEWPRQGVVDYNGDTVNGIPKQIKAACAELAIRVLNGTVLEQDYDPNLVGAGGIVSSITKKVGPLEKVVSYDTKLGIGFFASFPIVDRMLSKAGLLKAGGGRSVMH